MVQDLIAYLIVFLSAIYLVRRAVRKEQGGCCASGACPAASQSLLQIGPGKETLQIQD